jgi:hypothetical protein
LNSSLIFTIINNNVLHQMGLKYFSYTISWFFFFFFIPKIGPHSNHNYDNILKEKCNDEMDKGADNAIMS